MAMKNIFLPRLTYFDFRQIQVGRKLIPQNNDIFIPNIIINPKLVVQIEAGDGVARFQSK